MIVAGMLLPGISHAQVVPAIKGGGSQINVYGFYTLMNPDGKAGLNYPPGVKPTQSQENAADKWNELAGGVGADFRLGRFVFGQPALGARFTFSDRNSAKESTYLFGPEMHYAFGRFRPYGNFYLGTGDVNFGSSATGDNSIVYDVGGGVDYHVNSRINIRLADFQYQFWNLGTHTYPAGLVPGEPSFKYATTLQPYTLNFGLLFRIR
jgi:hypothetical protein